jgi:hypothetical protein
VRGARREDTGLAPTADPSARDPRARSWIGHYFRLVFGGRYVRGSIVTASTLFLGGLIAAAACGFWDAYLDSRIWLIAVGIAWVLAWGERSDRHLYDLPRQLRPAMRAPEDPSFDELVTAWHARLYNMRRSLGWGLVGVVALGLLTYFVPEFGIKRLPKPWHTAEHVVCAKCILIVYFGAGALLMITMLFGFRDYISFTQNVLTRELTLDLSSARASLRHITRFGLDTGLGWSVGVALSVGFFARNSSPVATGALAVLALLGFALILVPQQLAYEALARTRDELLDADARRFDVRSAGAWTRRFVVEADEETPPAEGLAFLAEIVGTAGAVIALVQGT